MPINSGRAHSDAQRKCLHETLCFEPSSYAAEVSFERPGVVAQKEAQKICPELKHQRGYTSYLLDNRLPSAFPTPLILPGDDLACDPDHEAQNFKSWKKDTERNEVTEERNVIYMIAPPEIDSEVDFLKAWASPQSSIDTETVANVTLQPKMEDILAYLEAFYTGMIVKPVPARYQFTSWDGAPLRPNKSRSRKSSRYIGLTTSSSTVRIRTRPAPTFPSSTFPPFTHQLHLDDLLDALIEDLPSDAYAALLLVRHDLYESDDDDFCMGRAYGGSRVAIVSMGRYDPGLDKAQGINTEHAWPAAHCATFVKELIEEKEKEKKGSNGNKRRAVEITRTHKGSPLDEAVEAYRLQWKDASQCNPQELQKMWLSRVCRTASHELGHCFGMDHCAYYACNMQGTASLHEDARQPPYLCPVDLAKLRMATGRTTLEHYRSLLAFCELHSENAFFAALATWLSEGLLQVPE
ncbi:MAG: hypothetical protein M1821_004364 [Bathelium mastoideum]|nr:MAG: hypothetical protein M1821_004364 [Bathelium mastoideum]KAI9683970.1 MAG: hypothetical protein M1822_005797 [Bathelium mastoideum]